MAAYVVDASVVIRLIVNTRPLADRAQALFARLQDTPPIEILAPDLLYAECANGFWKFVRFQTYDAALATGHLADVRSLPLKSTPTLLIADRALGLAIALSISAYDACYVALAEIAGCPLVTADERLIRRLAGGPIAVEWLGAL
jgi:predicted nucleic acid-binding protein